jgi:hypothetical protein
LDRDKLNACIEQLDEVVDWKRGSVVELAVKLEDDEYYVDLGAFGEQTMYVCQESDYYPIDVDQVMDHAPRDVEEIRDTLREILEAEDEKEPSSLDDVLAQMAATGTSDEKKLALVLMAVADAVRHFPTTGAVGAPPALPATPAPWPGALRDNIDYTADDFPLRYQPPPGYVWTKAKGTTPVPYTEAEKLDCEALRSGSGVGEMILDANGCISWIKRDGDELADDNGRWALWLHERDGIPAGNGNHNHNTLPLPIAERGARMNGWVDSSGRSSAWRTTSDWDTARRRIEQMRAEYTNTSVVETPAEEKPKEEFAPPEPVTL